MCPQPQPAQQTDVDSKQTEETNKEKTQTRDGSRFRKRNKSRNSKNLCHTCQKKTKTTTQTQPQSPQSEGLDCPALASTPRLATAIHSARHCAVATSTVLQRPRAHLPPNKSPLTRLAHVRKLDVLENSMFFVSFSCHVIGFHQFPLGSLFLCGDHADNSLFSQLVGQLLFQTHLTSCLTCLFSTQHNKVKQQLPSNTIKRHIAQPNRTKHKKTSLPGTSVPVQPC